MEKSLPGLRREQAAEAKKRRFNESSESRRHHSSRACLNSGTDRTQHQTQKDIDTIKTEEELQSITFDLSQSAASEGVPIRFFSGLIELVDAYYSPSMGLVTHLQFPVQREDEMDDEAESSLPPQLPPRNFTNDTKEEQVTKSLSDTYMARLQHMDLSILQEEHQAALQDYFRTSICLTWSNEISRVLPSLEMANRVLDQQLSPGIGHLSRQISVDSLQSTSFRLEQLTKLLYSIEDKARGAVYGSAGYEGGHRKSLIPAVTFEVKQESLGIATKMFLKVDVESGKLFYKKAKDGPEDKYYVHNKILQLVKSQKMPAKISINVESEKEKVMRKEFVFEDAKKREGFCQLLQLMKNKHSEKPEPDMITLFIGTFNMGNATPPHNLSSWFLCKGQGKTRDDTAENIPHDIYVVGTQEDPLGERDWAETVKSTLRNMTNISFKQVAIHTLWNIRIVVLAKPEHENKISHIFSDSVKTGIANTLGNKGAVGVSFMFNGTKFGFVNSHLTSGSEKKLRRNQNYISILRFLNLGDKKLTPFDITHQFTHLFWLGDLNYRVEMQSTEAEYIVTKIKQQQYQELLSKDQLNMEMSEEKVFLHFEEEEITFAPTYRFERYTREKYAYTKAKATHTKYNLPSWCDRVLRKSYPLVHVVCHAYGCTNDIVTSDHSPVFASYEVGVVSQFVSKQDPDSSVQGKIQIMNCVATLLTKSQTRFFIEYHSSCLEKPVKTAEGDNTQLSDGFIKVWFGSQVQLTPIISDPEYLLDQHILICVKSTDCDESYGEGCVALRAAQFCFTEFQITLTHNGEKTGTLKGGIQLHTTECKPTEKLYDFIKVERDDPGSVKSKGGEKLTLSQALDISNPSYMGVSYKSGKMKDKGWSYSMQPKAAPGSRSPTSKHPAEDGKKSEMFDNPLYGSMASGSRPKDQQKDLLVPPDSFVCGKPAEGDPERPPLPTPRTRSFTCSETSPQASAPVATHPMKAKKPVMPSRSDTTQNKPRLPLKSRPGGAEPPNMKVKDYREAAEIPGKQRAPTRPGQTSRFAS
ncbi:hypothetical protein WMY93_024607 [Mugilogobius chulae]|uniref:phosphatidylinositol-3,4,5-trisphosphate 5-phosphatase n=1 Tax=Mugilogobius chulae TaxID=88201 RepID=A0AAW0NB36_9GOBI